MAVGREELGSWGNEGIEIACKAWLSGGRVLVNHNCWYAHLFRTKPQNNFGFPWTRKEEKISVTKKKVWDEIVGYKLPNQIHPVSWLIKKFMPVPGWDEEKINALH